MRRFLESEEGADAVRALKASAHVSGVDSVPHFDIEGTIITGAQRAKNLRQAIIDAHEGKADDADSTLRSTNHERV